MTQFAGAFPAPSWTPPAREPFIPLRPLTLGQILAGAFRALRHNPAVTLGPAIVVSIAAALASTGFRLGVVMPLLSRWGSGIGEDPFYFWFAAVGAGLFGWVLAQSLAEWAGIIQQGVSALDVSHAVVGRRLTAGGMRRRSRGVRGRLLAWSAIVVVVLALFGTLAVATLGLASSLAPLLGVAAVLVLFPSGMVVLVWLGTKLAFVPSVIVVERCGIGAAMARSWRLTRHGFWRSFGIRILCWGMIWFATALVSIPVQLLAGWLTSILAGNGDAADTLALQTIGEIGGALVGAVIVAIGLVITSATDAILYLDLRMRREGLDLELARFLEQRHPGTRFDPAETDPYRPPNAGPATVPVPAARPGSPWA